MGCGGLWKEPVATQEGGREGGGMIPQMSL